MQPASRRRLSLAMLISSLVALLALAACNSQPGQQPARPFCANALSGTAAQAGVPYGSTLLGFQELSEPQASTIQRCLSDNRAVLEESPDDDTAVLYLSGGLSQNVIDDNSVPADPYYPFYQGLWALADQIDSGRYPQMSPDVRDVLLDRAVRIDPQTGNVHQAYRLDGETLIPVMGPVLHHLDQVVTDDTDPADTALFVDGHTTHKKVYRSKPVIPTRVVAPAAPVRRPAADSAASVSPTPKAKATTTTTAKPTPAPATTTKRRSTSGN